MGEKNREDLKVEEVIIEEVQNRELKSDKVFQRKILIPNLIFHSSIHLFAIYGLYLCFTSAKIATSLWALIIGYSSGVGIVVGSHRGYSHRCFKATTSLRLLLNILHVVAGQNSTLTWTRDHRLHHKYSDTDADPHNSKCGFFFAHVGWLLSNKHPLVIEKGKQINLSDLKSDKIVMFQHKYFISLYFVFGFFIPTLVPYYFWSENIWTSFFVAYCLRYATYLNITWCVNSVAHFFGNKPYDSRIKATQMRWLAILSGGEGWHNYHHCFPWDYRTSELGFRFDSAAKIIEFFEKIGMAYDLKSVPKQIVLGHVKRHGDGTHCTVVSADKKTDFDMSDKIRYFLDE